MSFEVDRNKLRKDVSVTVECLPEHVPVRGNALASGDPAEDRAAEDYVLAQLRAGNPWAWCTVRVTISLPTGTAESDYLGCCSYESEEAFRRDCLEDMVQEAVERLAVAMEDGHEQAEKYRKES